MFKLFAMIVTAAVISVPATAKESKKTIAGWTVVKSEDSFSDSEKVMVMKVSNDFAIMLRCFSGAPNLAMVTPERYEKGDSYDLKLRLDKGPIVEAGATALTSNVMESNDIENYFYRDMRTAKTIAIRISGASSVDHKISLLGLDQAFSEFGDPCKISQ